MRPTDIFILLALLPATPAFASAETSSDPGQVLEEVVVSGYRLKPALESDVSLSLLTREEIEQASVVHFEELIPQVPNMNLAGEGSRARYLQLRGIGEREQYEGAPNPSVGFFIDDIDLSGIGGIASVFDFQRAEVLRGPQSARFGSSALAGVVYLESAGPTDRLEAHAELTSGDDGLMAAGAAFSGPVSANLRGRLSVYRHGSDGFRHNVFLGQATNDRDELTVRGKLDFDWGSGWSGLLTLLYANNDNGYDAWTVRNDDRTHSNRPGRDEQRTTAGSLRIEGPLRPAFDLVSITSLADTDVLFSFDGDWGSDEFWRRYGEYAYDYEYLNPRQRDTVSQELRLVSTPEGRWFGGSTEWVLGLAWRDLDEDNRIDSAGVYDDSGEEAWCTPCLTDRQVDSAFESRILSLFASTESTLTERLSLSLGLRVERWSMTYTDRWRDINYPGPPEGTSCARFDCQPDDSLWGGHLGLGYDFSERTRAYVRLARGFKAGGFNPSLAALQGVAILGPQFISYGPEALVSFEIGLKRLWLDDALATDVAVFYMDRDEAQLSQSSQQVAFDPNSFVFVTYNGAAHVRGLDASAQWRLDDTWRLHGALGLLRSEIDDSPASRAVSPGVIGRDLAHAPSYTLNLGASFATESGWFGRMDINAADAFYYDISHNQSSDAATTVNLRIGKNWGDWSLSAWVRNLTDETYYTRGFFFGNEPPGFAPTLYTRFGDPRSAGLSLSWRRGDG